MKIVVVGSGAREHALAWRLACGSGTTPRADREVVVVPGNPGIARFFRCRSLSTKSGEGFAGRTREGVMSVIVEEQPDLVVIGPETYLDQGVADDCQTWGIPCFGPTAAAAGLESSKAFMKDVAQAAGVPTAAHVVVRDAAEAAAFIDAHGGRVVVKADGLAAGKGVVVCNDVAQANAEVRAFLGESGAAPRFGHASSVVVVEARLGGDEVSVFAICDGEDAVLFGAARDHKRLRDGDEGPNTGGMGAVGPLGVAEGITDEFLDDVRRRFFVPTLKEMKKRGTPFRGVLFAGLMVDHGEAMLLEYNVRFGDPEAEVLLAAYDQDLAPMLLAVAEGERLPRTLRFHADHKVAAVVVAAPGYPYNVETGGDVTGLYAAERQLGVQVFCAGVARDDVGLFLVDGGRVVTVVGRGATFAEAKARAYRAVDKIAFEGMQVRRDIGASV
jgi:phosphoribosylamine--glycine ligase